MKIIYALIISILFGINPIAAQQEAGAEDPLFAADLVCHANATPRTQIQGSLALPTSLDPAPRIDTGSQEVYAHTEILNSTITQDSIFQSSDPHQYPEPIDPTAIDAFFMYPNPTTGIVQVKLSGKISVLIYTISGQLIKKYTLAHGDRVLDLNELPAGIYQVRAKSDEDYFSGKLLIQ